MKRACNPEPSGFTHPNPEFFELGGMTNCEFHRACRQTGLTPLKNKNLVT